MSQRKGHEYCYLGAGPHYLRDSVQVLTKHRNLIVRRNVTWQRALPAPSVPAQTSGSLSTEDGGSVADDEGTSDQGGGGGG